MSVPNRKSCNSTSTVTPTYRNFALNVNALECDPNSHPNPSPNAMLQKKKNIEHEADSRGKQSATISSAWTERSVKYRVAGPHVPMISNGTCSAWHFAYEGKFTPTSFSPHWFVLNTGINAEHVYSLWRRVRERGQWAAALNLNRAIYSTE